MPEALLESKNNLISLDFFQHDTPEKIIHGNGKGVVAIRVSSANTVEGKGTLFTLEYLTPEEAEFAMRSTDILSYVEIQCDRIASMEGKGGSGEFTEREIRDIKGTLRELIKAGTREKIEQVGVNLED